jgi:hypothetical protein
MNHRFSAELHLERLLCDFELVFVVDLTALRG